MAAVHRKFNRNKTKYLAAGAVQALALLTVAAAPACLFCKMPGAVKCGITAAMVLAGAGVFRFAKRRAGILKSGIEGEGRAVQMLKKLPAEFHVIANPVFCVRGKTAELDALVIGAHSVWIVETKNHAGVITGRTDSEFWRQEKRSETKQMKNPLLQAERQQRIVKELLYSLGEKCPVETAVYFANPKAEIGIRDARIFTQEAALQSAICRTKRCNIKNPAALSKKVLAECR